VRTGARLLPRGRRYSAQRALKVLQDSVLPFETMYLSKALLCNDELLLQLLTADFVASLPWPDLMPPAAHLVDVMRSDLPDIHKASYVDFRLRLLDDMLVKVDRMSMAHSLEVRSPFLDHRLVEAVAAMPPSFKLRGWQTKAILRDTVRRYLPPATLRKRKQGFSVPLREWFRAGLSEMVGDYLAAGNSRLPPGMFDRGGVELLLSQHRNGQADHSHRIWLLLNYAAWHDLYVHRKAFVGSCAGC
jgi:asparagine synthase (glutamine-hydrolysing)